jgi:hypothetical protein
MEGSIVYAFRWKVREGSRRATRTIVGEGIRRVSYARAESLLASSTMTAPRDAGVSLRSSAAKGDSRASLSGTGIWSGGLRYGDAGEAVEAAGELESLGYSALWIPDTGGDLFESLERLLGATTGITVASGILNLWMHTPEATAEAYAAFAATYGDRLLVGIGVSHAPLIDASEPGRYRNPLASTAAFLDGLDAAVPPLPSDRRVLAALGPKMLELARERTAGKRLGPKVWSSPNRPWCSSAIRPGPGLSGGLTCRSISRSRTM